MTLEPRPRATLGPRRRIRKAADFRAAYAARNRAADDHLVVYVRPNGRPESRVGLSVGRRVGNAVCRNRTKRRLRDAFRRAGPAVPHGYDVVLVALAPLDDLADTDRRLADLVARAVERCRTRRAPDRKASGP